MLGIKAAKDRGVPLVVVETVDQLQSTGNILREVNGKINELALLRWDSVRGFRGLPPKNGTQLSQATTTMIQNMGSVEGTGDPDCLKVMLPKVNKDAIVFLHNAHKYWSDAIVMQGISNNRDDYKANGVMLVMYCPDAGTLPAELKGDVLVLSDPLPTEDEIADIIASVLDDAKVPKPTDVVHAKLIDTMLGLSSFEAEQSLALSLNKDDIDVSGLWDRKCKTISQTGGLTVYRGEEKYADVGGLDNGKRIMRETVQGRMRISAIVLIDEIDKAMAASGSDSSGVTQDQNRVLLTYIQDNNRPGILALGPAGCGKTLLCKAVANECGIPLIMLDLGAMMSRYVGDSQGAIRAAMKVIHAISSGRALFVATANKSDNLPPELRRRFNYSSVFFDLPDMDERDSAWRIHKNRYELRKDQCDQFDDTGWTGAEIHNACLKAWATGCKISEAAKDIVPISKTAAEPIMALRRAASGKYISASTRGIYQFHEEQPATGRKIRF